MGTSTPGMNQTQCDQSVYANIDRRLEIVWLKGPDEVARQFVSFDGAEPQPVEDAVDPVAETQD